MSGMTLMSDIVEDWLPGKPAVFFSFGFEHVRKRPRTLEIDTMNIFIPSLVFASFWISGYGSSYVSIVINSVLLDAHSFVTMIQSNDSYDFWGLVYHRFSNGMIYNFSIWYYFFSPKKIDIYRWYRWCYRWGYRWYRWYFQIFPGC